ncbi:hypothetical protein M0D69_03290 [Caballeronia sp. SEWSISQ10-4 2]|uniref:hypothetical protein n=1 Tax=Caballeronia sp. SEWSISQ10-4 2 TaxID=2937438 RepID=UPI00264EA993|nr:hypothetical protein [Caballeronia sp. SEWSISQ10-4 2]MDN7177054.1 hypothetical protein [Caballeronia sp. SEWSISQ10-4 2]
MHHRPGPLDTFGRRMLEQHGEIFAVKAASHVDQLATDASQDATRGLSLAHAPGQVTLDRFTRRLADIPGAQRG